MLVTKDIICKAGKKHLLDSVSVSFDPGKLHLIIGPNGAGKSTLIKALSGQVKPASGSVMYGDRNAGEIEVTQAARMRAVLSQFIELAFPLTVAEVVMMGRYPHFSGIPEKKDVAACDEAMHFFEIAEMAGRDYQTLSGGEKQRVNFARVMAQIWYPDPSHARYLLLDEPLTFLDVHYQFTFMHQLQRLCRQTDLTIVGVVHDLNLAAKFADHLVLLHAGKVLADGNRDTVLTKEHIRTAYHLEPVIHRQDNSMYLFFE